MFQTHQKEVKLVKIFPTGAWPAVSMCSPHQAHSASSGEQFPLLNFSLKTAVLRKAAPIAGYDPPAARTPAA